MKSNIGNAVRELRMKQKMTQGQLASKCKISVNFLGLIENGKRKPSNPTIDKMARALKIEPEILVVLGISEDRISDSSSAKLVKQLKGLIHDVIDARIALA